MKNSIWDILTGVVLLGVLCLAGVFLTILVNPNVGINPFRPAAAEPQLVPTVSLPTPTETLPGMPPTWTPTPQATATIANAVDPNLQPSSTPMASPTPFRLPTFTGLPPTQAGVASGRCQVAGQIPADDTIFEPGARIYPMEWTIRNTSDSEWRADAIDLRFINGDKMHNGPDAYDLTTNIGTNADLKIIINDMFAPASSGTYISNWGLFEGDKSVCRFFVQIKVRRPN